MSDRRAIDLVVTDLGGTLVRTDEAIMTAVCSAARELGIPDGYAEPVYDVFGTSIGDTDHDIRQARKAGVLSASGQGRKHLRKIQAQKPGHLLDSFRLVRSPAWCHRHSSSSVRSPFQVSH